MFSAHPCFGSRISWRNTYQCRQFNLCIFLYCTHIHYMARPSVLSFSHTYTHETLPRARSLPLHLTPTLRSDAAISLLHLYAEVAFTATTTPGLNTFPYGLVSRLFAASWTGQVFLRFLTRRPAYAFVSCAGSLIAS
jgi:hypothetical protein